MAAVFQPTDWLLAYLAAYCLHNYLVGGRRSRDFAAFEKGAREICADKLIDDYRH